MQQEPIRLTLPRFIDHPRQTDRTFAAEIVTQISEESGIPALEILSGSRVEEALNARWRAFAELSALGWGHSRIARALGFDHTTVRNALQRMAEKEAQS